MCLTHLLYVKSALHLVTLSWLACLGGLDLGEGRKMTGIPGCIALLLRETIARTSTQKCTHLPAVQPALLFSFGPVSVDSKTLICPVRAPMSPQPIPKKTARQQKQRAF